MFCRSLIRTLAASAALFVVTPVLADWSDDAFPVKEHDFGTVAVAAKAEFRFPVVNRLDRALHIRTVRASCGCTTPVVETRYIEPGKTGSILARYNTRSFQGKRGATLTVVFDKPYYREVRLRVDGYIRRDMVLDPGAIEFGKVDAGTSAEQATRIYYAGREDWKIVDVRSNRPWITTDFEQTSRGRGKINYELTVTLREDAPTGAFKDQLVVVTNDRARPRVPVSVSGEVESAYTVAPRLIALGDLKPGESVGQRLVIRGEEPFAVEAIECEGWKVEFERSDAKKKLHILNVAFTASDVSGPQKSKVRIRTGGEEAEEANALLTAVVGEQ